MLELRFRVTIRVSIRVRARVRARVRVRVRVRNVDLDNSTTNLHFTETN